MPTTYLEYKRDRATKEQRWRSRNAVRTAVDAGAAALGQSPPDYEALAAAVDVLASVLVGPDGRHLSQYASVIGQRRFAIQRVLRRRASPSDYPTAFDACEAIVRHEGIIRTDSRDGVPATEYEHQVGERYYSPETHVRQDASLIEPDDEMQATLFTGGQGSGKSTAIETVVEDRVAHGHKVIDLIDFLKAENVMYDVPAQNESLRAAREEMGLDTGFNAVEAGFEWLFGDGQLEDAYLGPDVEIRVPLTPDLAEMDLPYDTAAGEFVVKPFAVPAADLSYRQLVMILPHVTKTHEQHLRAAYQTLDQRDADWTLADMAEAVREDTNAGDALSNRIERSLETVQNKAFIRDEQVDDDLLLDWESLMADADTVTAFTMFSLAEKADRLLLASYLLDSLYDARKELLRDYKLHAYPPLTTVIRELHQIIPRSKSEQDAEATIEGYMVGTMSELIALVRHANMELLCDTQKFKQQLSPDVSKLFTRIFAFSGQKPDIKKVFRTRVDDTDPAEKVSQYDDPGRCALVSDDGYALPIQFAPPRCHHLDARRDGNGLRFRVDHPARSETFREAPWDASIPPRLEFDDVPASPIRDFVYESIRETGNANDFVRKAAVADAYQKWSEENDEPSRSPREVKSWIASNMEWDDGKTRRAGDGQVTCWWGIELLSQSSTGKDESATGGPVEAE